MRIERRRRIARALVGVLLATGQALPAATAAPTSGPLAPERAVETAEAPAPVVAANCAAAISCGGGCIATLSTGFCILVVKWTGGARVGGIQLGPTIRAECHICECWYTYTNSIGNTVFKRTTDLDCDASVGGLHVL